MSRILKAFGAALLITAVASTAAAAQRRPVELGLDASFLWYNPPGSNDDMLLFDLPMGGLVPAAPFAGLRLGIPVSTRFSVEPALGFDHWNEPNDDYSMTRLALSTSLKVHRYGSFERTDPFIGLGGNFSLLSADDIDTDTQFGIYAFAGLNTPLIERLSLRATVGAGHFFESDQMSKAYIGFATVGFSFWPGGGGSRMAAR